MKVIVDGCEFKSIKEMCDALDISYKAVCNRTSKRKMTLEDAVKDVLAAKEGLVKNIVQNNNSSTKEQIEEKEIIEETIVEDTNTYVEGLDNLVSNILKYRKNKINLIDFENFSNYELMKDELEDTDTINVFFYNALIQSNKYYKITRGSKSINLSVMIFEPSNQLIDKLIIYSLGALTSRMPEKDYTIISKDKGYDSIIDCLKPFFKIKKKNIQLSINKNKEKFLYALCKFISYDKDITQYTVYSKKDLKRTFSHFYRQRNKVLDEPSLEGLMEILSENNILKLGDVINGYQYYYIDTIKSESISKELDKKGLEE